VTTGHESGGGGFRHSLFWKLLGAFVMLAVLPLAATGILVAIQVDRVREQADHISRTYERRAECIATRVSDLLDRCESDLRRLAKLPRTDKSYTVFAARHKKSVWIRAGTDDQMQEERLEVSLYKEVSYIGANGMEKVLIVRGRPVPAERHRNVSDPRQTTYRSERYFPEAMKLDLGQIYVSRLTGFHVNKIEQLGIEKIIPRLKKKNTQDKQIYRYLLYETLRTAGAVEYVSSFEEGNRTVLVYRIPGESRRILVDSPLQVTPEELRARELELQELLGRLAPEDTVEGVRYDGVIRFAMPVAGPDGRKEGVVSIALDHLHLMQFTQHVKAMEDNATVFAGYRDADYTYLFDDQGWIITHPKYWNIRGVDRTGEPVLAYAAGTSKSAVLAGRTPVNLLVLDWKMGEGYHALILETRAGRTGIATSNNLAGVLRTRVFSPIFYSTGPYAKHGIFGGVMLGTRVDKFIKLLRQLNAQIATKTTQVRHTIIWVLSGVLAVVALLSVLISRGLVRPLRSLTDAARRVGAGDLNTPVPFCGRDEIGELADSFRDMTHSLKQTIDQLEQRNVELKKAQQKLLKAEKEKRRELQFEVNALQKEITRSFFAHMIAESPAMKKILEEIVRISKSSATVMILGENGTGKELVAEAIHRNSPRRDRKFVRINCAAFNENLIESELFGHVKGSYTGATSSRKGLFESADGGTLLLDEIGDMSPSMQKKLLRTLQEGEVVPVGSTQVTKVDVRIITATNKDLVRLMKAGQFREDLFHRINVITIKIPPLRERRKDVLPLVMHFLKSFCEKENKPHLVLDTAAEEFLVGYPWPGNVRELENAVERAVIRSRGSYLQVEDFQLAMEGKDLPCVVEGTEKSMTLEEVEKAYTQSVLEKNNGNKKLTAKQLGIGYNTLWRKLKKYNET
jgi:DNA-binding NtrC family response regulator